MKLLRSSKWLIIGLFLSTSVALACPGDKGCQLKHCDLKDQAALCKTKESPTGLKNTQCNKGHGHIHHAHGDKKMCNKAQKYGKWQGKRCIFLGNLRYTLKNLDLKKSDWSDIKIAMNSYKEDIRKIHIETPIKSIQGGKLDRQLFLNTHPMQKKLAAQADLIETILLILNAKQKKKFAMLMGASQFQNRLHPQRGMGHGSCAQKNEIKLRTKPLKQ